MLPMQLLWLCRPCVVLSSNNNRHNVIDIQSQLRRPSKDVQRPFKEAFNRS